MDWRPRAVYDAGAGAVTVDLELAQRPWAFAPVAVGGSRRSAGGILAAYRVRHDELVRRTIRFTEDEWPAVRTWLLWAQEGGVFEWYDDLADVTTLDSVTLEAPAMGQPVEPTRSTEFPLVFEITITLRVEAGASTRAYFPDELES